MFFQAEDGIRDIGVTGVQTCALPISAHGARYDPSMARLLTALRRWRWPLAALSAVTLTAAALVAVWQLGWLGDAPRTDRKSGVLGKSVDLGGRRIIKKKKSMRLRHRI